MTSGKQSVPGAGGWWAAFVLVGRWSMLLLLAGLLLTDGRVVAGADSPVSKEYQLKAAFLYNFTKFVEWPSHRFAQTNSPIIIGVLGRNPFGGELEKIVKDRKVNGRDILVTNITDSAGVKAVHMVFISAGEEERWNEALTTLRGTAVLTVGESGSFARTGGMINFTLQADKVRFEINQDPAEAAGLKFSAQLLKLATAVHRKS
jgi:hypothetical protein